MQANQLKPPKGAKHARKRIGRGNASGHGTYSTKGLKGQKARSGKKPRRFFEGGQTELMRRLPRKRGFTNPFRVEFTAVNLRELELRFDSGAEITPEVLRDSGVISTLRKPVKILATGDITKKFSITAHRFSLTAREKIEAAGGSVTALIEDEPVNPNPKKRRLIKGKENAEARLNPKPKAVKGEAKDGAPKGKGKKGAEAVAGEPTPEAEAETTENEAEGDGDIG